MAAIWTSKLKTYPPTIFNWEIFWIDCFTFHRNDKSIFDLFNAIRDIH
ncbi:hypothetical protein SynWH8101_0634 [Synechococcus sp. WH 8101]|nr:hypothetical protein SynWH8101_0634 [Synechococcus sp. WH 8101]